jgi:hypothetical protein
MEQTNGCGKPLDIAGAGGPAFVIADLPKNSTSYAVQAEQAGADAILLNIDGEEGSSPGHYGSYDLHDAYVNDVISTVSVPCGILVGGGRALTEDYWERIMSSRFSFVEMYSHQMPLFVLGDDRLKKIAAIGAGYILEQVRQIALLDGVEAVDAAATPAQGRGTRFTVLDLSTVGVVVGISAKPVLLRTQKRMTRSDLGRVLNQGVKGFVVDPCIISGTEEAYKEELLLFKPAQKTPVLPEDEAAQIYQAEPSYP